jgi:hypothetical protein
MSDNHLKTLFNIAPELESKDGQRLLDFIELAKLRIGKKVFGDRYDLAVALLAAHMATLSFRSEDGNNNAGQITSEKEGELSRSYGQVAMSTDQDSAFLSTSYGQQFVQIRKESVMAVSMRRIC